MAISTINTAGLASNTVAPLATSLSTVVGSAPSYACRAWVNFNGIGTVAIRGSGNVSSITDLDTGIYKMNFSTAMSDSNYNVGLSDNLLGLMVIDLGTSNASGVQVEIYNSGYARADAAGVFISVFR